MTKTLEFRETADGIALVGDEFLGAKDGGSSWRGRFLDRQRIFMHKSDAEIDGGSGSLMWSPIATFKSMLVGLVRDGFTGKIVIDTGRGVKRIYCERGRIVFAGSNLIDDRLGEVIYRRAKIDIDQLTSSAVQVTRDQKFGQVLLNNQIFAPAELWRALVLQVLDILKSVFLVNHVFYSVSEDGRMPMHLAIPGNSVDLIEGSYALGCGFKQFLLGLSMETRIKVPEPGYGGAEVRPGTFYCDMIDLIRENQTVNGILKASKLCDINTFYALFRMFADGFVHAVAPSSDRSEISINNTLQLLLNRNDSLIRGLKAGFQDEGVALPITEVRSFLQDLDEVATLLTFTDEGYVDNQAMICLDAVFNQCPSQVDRIFGLFELLDSFWLQLSLDILPRSISGQIKKSFEGRAG